ncbi:alpha-2,8-polysialyltransferase family protein [Priestia flexa]|uniref:glycosyltransferase family 52 n=1 Tax=Priestia flexa TaxID=86664 RepID=UPI0020A121AF|nr:glycosyltransferase family 52 [Priestia flexa]MCP1188534.1 alpha-2,8-polysialyltransferase family protein [Priestia flexa]
MNFYVCSTPYHVFVSLCHLVTSRDKGTFYLTTHDDNSEKIFFMLKDRLLHHEYVENVIIRKRKRILDKLMIERLKDWLEFLQLKPVLKESNYHIYNFCWNPYSLYLPSNFLYKKAKKVTFIEEGSMLYAYEKPKKLTLILKKYLYGVNTDFYKDAKTKEILVQYPDKYPDFLSDKLTNLSFSELVKGINQSSREEILSIFIRDNSLAHKLNFTDKSVIILTQPLSEDGFITEKEKYKLYKNIIDEYKDTYYIVLKRHPREKTIYGFDHVLEIEGTFPSEILTILNLNFEKAIGICTSAIYNINATEKINIDENFLNRRK